jgi:hypothetical protein
MFLIVMSLILTSVVGIIISVEVSSGEEVEI